MTGLFSYFTGPKAPFHFSGISFALASILMLASAIIAYKALHPAKKEIAIVK
jgi:hypothetical protein